MIATVVLSAGVLTLAVALLTYALRRYGFAAMAGQVAIFGSRPSTYSDACLRVAGRNHRRAVLAMGLGFACAVLGGWIVGRFL